MCTLFLFALQESEDPLVFPVPRKRQRHEIQQKLQLGDPAAGQEVCDGKGTFFFQRFPHHQVVIDPANQIQRRENVFFMGLQRAHQRNISGDGTDAVRQFLRVLLPLIDPDEAEHIQKSKPCRKLL